MNQRILVTGGAGFIGSNFVRMILGQKDCDCLVNLDKLTYAGNLKSLEDIESDGRYTFVKGDVCDQALIEQLLREHRIGTIVHFAAESHVDRSITGPGEFVRTNLVGSFSMLEAARSVWSDSGFENKRFLHVSTDEVYGSLGETGLFSETTPYDPRSPYSASKAGSDHLASAYFHTYGMPVLITNCSNNYGPFQFPEKLIPLVINNALNGKELPVYGDGKNVRDWLFVEDHCQAILKVLVSGLPGETYNVGGNSEKQNIEVVQTICDLLDKRLGLINAEPRRNLIRFVKDRAGHDRRYAIDAGKIKQELGWTPRVSFEEGMASTIDWYLDNKAWLDSVLDGSYQDYYAGMYGDR